MAYTRESAGSSTIPPQRTAVTGDHPVAAKPARCRKCSNAVDASLPFCPHCGSRLGHAEAESDCRNCGARYLKGADLFCSRCGTRVGERVSLVKPTSAVIGVRDNGPRIAILDERGEPANVLHLDRGEAVIGRGDADIKFEFDVFLSPLHARLELRDGELWLRDLGSRNGTLGVHRRSRRS